MGRNWMKDRFALRRDRAAVRFTARNAGNCSAPTLNDKTRSGNTLVARQRARGNAIEDFRPVAGEK